MVRAGAVDVALPPLLTAWQMAWQAPSVYRASSYYERPPRSKQAAALRIRIEPFAFRRQLAHLLRRLVTRSQMFVFLQLRQHVR